jgi:hypothetical protein
MVNLAPQGPSLKCMVQEFAVPIVVGPSKSPRVQDQPQPRKPAHSVAIFSQTLLFAFALPACSAARESATLQDCTSDY